MLDYIEEEICCLIKVAKKDKNEEEQDKKL